jgi:hypothetical protein
MIDGGIFSPPTIAILAATFVVVIALYAVAFPE